MRALLLLVAAAALACSSASDPDVTATPSPRDAQMITRMRPELQIPRQPGGEGIVADIRVEVRVDTAGRPIMNTLRVTGIGAAENREAIRSWIEAAQFRPATRDGVAVASRFRTRLRIESRRVSGD